MLLNDHRIPNTLRESVIWAVTEVDRSIHAHRVVDCLRDQGVDLDPIEAVIQVRTEAKEAAETARAAQTTGAPRIEDRVKAARSAPQLAEPLTWKNLEEFLRENVTLEFLVDDMLVRGFLYALTGATGAGKTAVAVLLTLTTSEGRRFGKHETQRGAAVYIAGENPADVRPRFAVAVQQMGLHPDRVNVHILDRSFILAERIDELVAIVESLDAVLVVVDTDQAVSLRSGAEENDNAERMVHAKRLRELTRAKSRPVVLDLCHPRSRASKDDLIPRGGSSFLNEIDGNLCLWRDSETVDLFSDPNKYRGAPVALTFRKLMIESEAVKDTKGRLIPVPFFKLVDDDEADRARKEDWKDENRLLWAMNAEPLATQADWARACSWTGEDGQPRKDKVNRLLKRLDTSKLVKRSRSGRWNLTDAGKKEAQRP